MEDTYQNKYDNQSMIPDTLKFTAGLLLTVSVVLAFFLMPEYAHGQERNIVHYVLSIAYLVSGIFVAAVLLALSFITECLDEAKRR